MKKTILATLSLSAALLIGCADTGDSGLGAPAPVESETTSSERVEEATQNTSVSPADPGVASESGNIETPKNQSVESRFNTLGSASAPSANVPANVATNAANEAQPESSVDKSSEVNEQGTQTSPEPRTGDDANPDSVQPE
jgi:hypothetical protein